MSTCTYSREVLAKVEEYKRAEQAEYTAQGVVPTPGQKILDDAAAYVGAQMRAFNGYLIVQGQALAILADAYLTTMPRKAKPKLKVCWRNPNFILRHTTEPNLHLIQGGKA